MSAELNLRPWMPLPGDVWHAKAKDNRLYYDHAMEVLDKNVEFAVESERLPLWSEAFVKESLYFALMRQAERTGRITTIENPPENDPKWDAMLAGYAEPAELVSLWHDLGDRRQKIGIEVARLTHVGIWDTKNTITAPVVQSIVNNHDLQTQLVEGQPFFKLVLSDKGDRGDIKDSRGEIIERKRLIATHGGDPYDQKEELWMMRRDIMLVDFNGINQVIDADKSHTSTEAKQAAALYAGIVKNRAENRNQRVGAMNDILEPILAQPIDFRPRYIRPLLTTMYLRDPTENVRSTGDISRSV